jgi:hypothetical protein
VTERAGAATAKPILSASGTDVTARRTQSPCVRPTASAVVVAELTNRSANASASTSADAELSNRSTSERTYCERMRRAAMLAYGNGSCAICGAELSGRWELHHVNGDGETHRRELIGSHAAGNAFLKALKRLGWPNDPPLQTLCVPCHRAKHAA